MEYEKTLIILLSSLCSMLAVRWAYFKILKIAKEKKLVDNPDARKLQRVPVPVLGGIVVFFGVICGLLMGAASHTLFGYPNTTRLLPALTGMMIMLYVGAMDDVVGLSPLSRIIIEVLTILGMIYGTDGCIDTFHNMFGINTFSWYIGVPLTVFAGVGIINSINMIDGVNGLSSGLCAVCSFMFGIAFIWIGDTPNAVLAFTMASSLLPFIAHNVFGKRSKMFIGDAGTMVMGILMTWFVINMLRSDSPLQYYITTKGISWIALCLAIMSVPVFDTLRVMTQRIGNGHSPFSPDKTHLHHVFIKAGVSHSVTSIMEILLDIIIVGIWALSVVCGLKQEGQLYVVLLTSMTLIWGLYFFLQYNEEHHTEAMHKMARFSVYTHLGHRRWWLRLQEFLDRREEMTEEEEKALSKHLENRYFHENTEHSMEKDKVRVIHYMKGKAEVLVESVIERSEAHPRNAEKILELMIQSGEVVVIKREIATPTIVALADMQ